ncbi:MAG: aldehyde ferredoxin oxidoreductase family protein [Eubacteriales bacterium]
MDLTSGNVSTLDIPKELFRRFLGGRGLAARLLFELLPRGIEPLGPENLLLVLTGPLTGTSAIGSGKFVVASKSPVSGGFVDSYASGRLAVEIKASGFDGMALTGQSPRPIYLLIDQDRIALEPAEELWGKDTFQTEEMLRNKHGSDIGLICIGPAGENLVKFASINSDYYRQAARGGVGAVMGSKKLKAVVVRGTGGVKVADMPGFMELTARHLKLFANSKMAQNRSRYGTPLTLDLTNAAGMLPTRNFQEANFPSAIGRLDAAAVAEYTVKSRACYGCPMACAKITSVSTGPYEGTVVEGPEYETVGLFGSNLGVDYLPAIIKANLLCDKLGLDTISTGNVIGFIMECSEKGIWPDPLIFGDYEKALELIGKIAYREDSGNMLAEGVRALSLRLGEESTTFAMQVKGLEMPAYDPRVGYGTALSYALSPRGACHRRAWPPAVEVLGSEKPYVTEGKATTIKHLVDENSILHSLLVCDFPAKWIPLTLADYAAYMTLATGETWKEDELLLVSERIETQIRLFNNREGLTRQDDWLPKRVLSGERTIPPQHLKQMINEYYELRGWDESGEPKASTRQALEI